jgi:hypothetical protein
METVPFYDFDTKTVQHIPVRELSGNCVLAEMDGVGRVYVDAHKLKPGSIVYHQDLPEDLLKRVKRLFPIFKSVYEPSYEKWVDGFKRDVHPDKEVDRWEQIARTFQHFCKSGNRKVQNAIFLVALKCTMVGHPDEVVLTLDPDPLNFLGKGKVLKIVAYHFKPH